MTKKWEKHYDGFESLYDLIRDIQWAIERENVVPNGEYLGTLKVTMEYVDEENETEGE